jgi:hypothetical protein
MSAEPSRRFVQCTGGDAHRSVGFLPIVAFLCDYSHQSRWAPSCDTRVGVD